MSDVDYAHCDLLSCSDADLHMTALALKLCCTMMVNKKHHFNAGAAVRERVLPQALILVKTSFATWSSAAGSMAYSFECAMWWLALLTVLSSAV